MKKVMVKPKGTEDTPEMHQLASSGGAAYMFWQDASPDEIYFRLMQRFASIVRDDGIPADVVHKAFLVIPEYVATLPPCKELDDLKASGIAVELPKMFGHGYPL